MEFTKKFIATLTLSALLITSTTTSCDFRNQFKYGVRYPKYYPEQSFEELDESFEDSFDRLFQNTNLVPQGLTFDDNYMYVSMYDHDKRFNSVIVTLDFQGHFINICNLDNNAHVGGISYDRNNELIWVAAKNGNVDAYKKDTILNSTVASPYYKDLYVGKGLPNYINPFGTSVSFLTVKNDELFVGNFSLFDTGLIKRYKVKKNEDESIVLTMDGSFVVPNKVQGLSFFNKNGQDYMLLSRSFGNNDNSLIQIYKYDPSISDYMDQESTAYEFPAMIEETFIKDGMLYSLYETNSNPYQDPNKKNKTLRMSRIDSLY